MKLMRTRARKPFAPTHALRRRLEALESRDVPSVTINVSDASVKEQGNLTTFVPGNSAILQGPSGVAYGPDRNGDSVQDLYVLGRRSNNIVVYDGQTGAFFEQYVSAGSGLNGSAWMTFDANGDLYISTSRFTPAGARDVILRVDHVTKAVSTFVPSTANGGLTNARALAFGPDGNLYVGCDATHQVLRYNGDTGAFIDAFVPTGSGGLTNASGVLFGPDRNGDAMPDLYVGSHATDQVLLFDGVNGSPLGVFVAAGSGGLDGPADMQFGPDGNLYVNSSVNTVNLDQIEQVYRFDGTTGAFIDTPVAVGSGLGGATAFIAFNHQGELFVGGEGANEVLRHGAGPLVTLSEPSASPVTVEFSTAAGTAAPGSDYAAVTGRLTFAPGETSKRILVSAVDDGASEPSETFTVNLANATGATIGDGQGVVAVLNSQTKFFVVNDMTASPTGAAVRDETYRYESGGALVVANDVYFSATAVRGVASNLAGTRLWVLDANGTVYVCDNRNVYLGSWTAGGLNAQAQVEGITTNGTDIWLVDAKQDKVYRYAGAASLLSGSQNAISSFNLNNNNKNPKDLVTDGTSIWVVDDSGNNKVFKYSLTGALQGSWTITNGGGSPTGITLDPSNGQQHLWVVDNATDRVYQFDNARSRTSGSQAASATFALAAGNTNPQGIADPPPPMSEIIQPVENHEGPVAQFMRNRQIAAGLIHAAVNPSATSSGEISHRKSGSNPHTFSETIDGFTDTVRAKSILGTGNEIGWSIAVDSTGVMHLTSSFMGAIDFDTDPLATYTLNAARRSFYLLKLQQI